MEMLLLFVCVGIFLWYSGNNLINQAYLIGYRNGLAAAIRKQKKLLNTQSQRTLESIINE